jgi:hypothetical protein
MNMLRSQMISAREAVMLRRVALLILGAVAMSLFSDAVAMDVEDVVESSTPPSFPACYTPAAKLSKQSSMESAT